jgi:aminocarboxymuconate-semialdehyde decarboxylase
MGIDVQAVCPAPHQTYYWTEPGMGAELARSVNERIARIVAQWPERFVGMGTVPLQDAELAVHELTHCVKTLGLRGVEINPSVKGMDLTDPKLGLEKFFARAEALDIVLFMHPIGFTHGARLVDHYFSNVIGNPLETTVAASHLIFDGVIERHPKLKIVLPHAGGYLAHYWARMDHAYKARADCRGQMKRKPSSYLEKFYFDTITFDRGMLANLIERFGADHVLLGTDYPYDMGMEHPVQFIGGVPRLSAKDKDAIMGANAARLLKIGYNKPTRRRS